VPPVAASRRVTLPAAVSTATTLAVKGVPVGPDIVVDGAPAAGLYVAPGAADASAVVAAFRSPHATDVATAAKTRRTLLFMGCSSSEGSETPSIPW
jgi:hypothetical protein